MRFAKFAKVFRFILLIPAFIFGALLAFMCITFFFPQVLVDAGILPEVPPNGPTQEELASLLSMLIVVLVIVIFDIICFVAYASHKKAIKHEQETTYESKLSGKRKFRIFCRIFGIILMAMGGLLSLGHKPMIIIFFVGLVFLIISFTIRVRSHAKQHQISRSVEGNTITITFPKKDDGYSFNPFKCADVIQDAFNDGYFEIESFTPSNKKIEIVFSTPLSNKEIQAQYQRREKYYESRRKNADEMPEYFSEQTTITCKFDTIEGKPYDKKVAIYNTKVTEYKKDGKVVDRKEEKIFSHYEIHTCRDDVEYFYFEYKDGRKLIAKQSNRQVYTTENKHVVLSKRKA